MSKERNKAAAAAPPMDGQTAWTNEPESEAEKKAAAIVLKSLRDSLPASEGVANPYSGFAEPIRVGEPAGALLASEGAAGDGDDLERRRLSIGLQVPDTSQAGGKRKGPRKPRSPAKTVVFVERLFSRFTLAQRVGMYAMLSSVTEATLTDGAEQP